MFEIEKNTVLEIYRSFGRTEDQVEEDVETLTEWLKTQLHLPELMNKASIRNFLLLNKFSIEKTKQKIDWYYTIRTLLPEWFQNVNPNSPKRIEILKDLLLVMHPKLHNFCRVFFFGITAPGKYFPLESCTHFFNILELRLTEDCMAGDIMIVDFGNFGFEDVIKITPSIVAEYSKIYQKVYSMRLQGLYVINSPPSIAVLMSYMKPFVKAKVFQRIYTYKGAEILNSLFDNDYLPKEYGGNGPSLRDLNEILQAEFAKKKLRFEALEKLRVDESLRPEELKNDEYLGFYGNFKKLNVD